MKDSARAILVVDDDDEIREALTDALRFEGFTVESASDGQQAIDLLHARAVHAREPSRWLVLLDLSMPVMDGQTFLRIREHDPALATIPVIIVTAGGDCRQLKARHDIAGCLPKTVAIPDLLAAVAACP